jgi:uncharacterized membrane protein
MMDIVISIIVIIVIITIVFIATSIRNGNGVDNEKEFSFQNCDNVK